jgi:uncharacterized protein YcbK (DUF882 family)
MIFIKPGVRITGLRPEMVLAAVAAESVYREAGHDLTITACVDGKHMAGSLHYAGAAVDVRTRDVPADKISAILAKLKEALAGDFDVLLEGDHIHIEFQPKQSITNA